MDQINPPVSVIDPMECTAIQMDQITMKCFQIIKVAGQRSRGYDHWLDLKFYLWVGPALNF